MPRNGVKGVGQVNLKDKMVGVGDGGEMTELIESERGSVSDADSELKGVEGLMCVCTKALETNLRRVLETAIGRTPSVFFGIAMRIWRRLSRQSARGR